MIQHLQLKQEAKQSLQESNAFYILGRDTFKYYPLIHCNDSPKFELEVPEYKQ
jgi:hypothetical protein